jgi:hypothetical protein
MDGQLASLPLF